MEEPINKRQVEASHFLLCSRSFRGSEESNVAFQVSE